jgi:hypothetical protein
LTRDGLIERTAVFARIAARIDAGVVARPAFFGAVFALGTVFFFDPFLSETTFAPFFEAPFLETLLGGFRAAAFRDGVFFPECFLRVLVTIDLRDLPVAARFPLPALFCFLAAAPLAGMRFASKTVQMKSAIIHAPFAGGSLLSRRTSGGARG